MRDTLALKYRPHNFDDLVGNKNISAIFKSMSQQNKFPTAIFLSGQAGCGKTTSARIIASSILCKHKNEDGNPCGVCDDCIDIQNGKHPDVIEIDAASENSVQGIRELRSSLNYLPTRGDKRVVIIDEIHGLSSQAANAFLKTLEEPPEYVHFCMATTAPEKVIDTIRSRSLCFNFKPIQSSDITERLKFIADNEGISIDLKALQFISTQTNGGMRNAVMLLDQVSLMAGVDGTITSKDVMDIVGFISISDIQKLFHIFKDGSANELFDWLSDKLFSPIDVISSSINFLETLMFLKQGVSPMQFASKDNVPLLMDMASKLSVSDIVYIFNKFKQMIYDLRSLNMVSTSQVFKFGMLDIYNYMHGEIKAAAKETVQQAVVDIFSKFKAEFSLTRVPLETLVVNN